MVRILLLLGLASFGLGLPSAGALKSPNQEMASAVADASWREVLRIFNKVGKPTGDECYLAAYALMRLHLPEEARERLLQAEDLRFGGWDGWPTAGELRQRIDTVQQLLPPIRKGESGEPAPQGSSLVVYAGPPTAWSAPVLTAIPEFEAVGRRIFGRDVPQVRMVLFRERDAYERFFSAMFGVPISTAWQDGTGNINIVLFCEKSGKGRSSRPAGEPETIGNVLHELGHAWWSSYLMQHHGREWLCPSLRRPWLDEGLADYVAFLREPAYLARRKSLLLTSIAANARPPSYEELSRYTDFYEKPDVNVHYWLSALLVAELLGDRERGPHQIPKVLDAIGQSGDVNAALRRVTGKDPRKALELLIKRYWGSREASRN